MNLINELSNILIYYLIILEITYAYVINNRQSTSFSRIKPINKSCIKRSSSDKDLQIYDVSTKASYFVKKKDIDVRPPGTPLHITTIEYLEDGEVSWEVPSRSTIRDYSFTKPDSGIHSVQLNMEPTRTTRNRIDNVKVNIWRPILASFTKILHKEIYKIELVYNMLANISDGKNEDISMNSSIGSNLFFLLLGGLLRYGYTFNNSHEIQLLKDTFRETNSMTSLQDYIRIKRITRTILILFVFIFTKNIGDAE